MQWVSGCAGIWADRYSPLLCYKADWLQMLPGGVFRILNANYPRIFTKCFECLELRFLYVIPLYPSIPINRSMRSHSRKWKGIWIQDLKHPENFSCDFFFSNASKIDRFRAFSLPRIMWRWHRKCYSFCDMLIRLKYLKECAGQKGCVSKIHVLSWNCGFCPALAEEGKMPPRMPQQHIYVAPKVHSVFLGCTERRLTPSGLVPQWGCLLSVMQHQEHVRCLSKVGEESRFPASVMHVTKDQCF